MGSERCRLCVAKIKNSSKIITINLKITVQVQNYFGLRKGFNNKKTANYALFVDKRLIPSPLIHFSEIKNIHMKEFFT